jgi:predicted DNA-binding transcriptional regulator AlpA
MPETSTNASGERVARSERAEGELLDVRAVATLRGCSTRHVIRLSDAGRMPRPVKLGALTRWNRRLIIDWCSAGCPAVCTKGRAAQ